jgi:hypothetical protein
MRDFFTTLAEFVTLVITAVVLTVAVFVVLGVLFPGEDEHTLPPQYDTVLPVSVLFPCYEDQYLMLVNGMAVCVNMDDVHSLAIEDWQQRNPPGQ